MSKNTDLIAQFEQALCDTYALSCSTLNDFRDLLRSLSGRDMTECKKQQKVSIPAFPRMVDGKPFSMTPIQYAYYVCPNR